jgi:hypothetical protein
MQMFKLRPELSERINALRQAYDDARASFANLNDEDLAASAKFWMQHCQAPKQIEPNTVVYDSTFWHAIVPEMISRLEKRGK